LFELVLILFDPRYLAHLVHDGEFSQAAALCPRLLQYDVEMWNRWVLVFAEHDQLLLIGTYVRLSCVSFTCVKAFTRRIPVFLEVCTDSFFSFSFFSFFFFFFFFFPGAHGGLPLASFDV